MRQETETERGPRIIVALDFPSAEQAFAFSRRLDPRLCRVKVGFELFVSGGPSLVQALTGSGFDVFLDLKFHDIPNTVAAACRAAAGLGVWMINVHASGGTEMMTAARDAVRDRPERPRLIAVTVLTSMDDADMAEIGIREAAAGHALGLAGLAARAGLDGVVCSAAEAREMRRQFGDDFLLVTPGIRTGACAGDDQKRIMTPGEAIEAGADYLVMGRPITRVDAPLMVLEAVDEAVGSAWARTAR